MHLLGLDIGTTGCKASVFELDGTLLVKATREYAVDIPYAGWAEQDADKVWLLAQSAMQEVVKEVDGMVGAVGLSVQGEAVMPVDAGGRLLRPAILGMDTRTAQQNEWLVEKFGAEHLFQLTGMPVHTINTLPKLLWIRQNEPDIWRQSQRFLLYEDYLIQRMTGAPAISRCLASRTQVYDLINDCWSAEILAELDLDSNAFAPVFPSGSPVGRMNADLSRALGFAEPPLIATGGHDQACGALGVGLTEPGLAMVSTGTAEVVEVAMQTPALNESLYRGNLSVYAHVLTGLYLSMTINHSGGLLLRWFRDTFGELEIDQAAKTGGDAYNMLLQNAPDEPTGLFVLPHFAGSGSPTFDTRSKGAILGLTFANGKADIAKAILEGLTYELRTNLDMLKEGGVGIGMLRAIGGGAHSPLWLQIKADITGIPVAAPKTTEAASWGAALLAGTAAGCFVDTAKAANEALQIQQTYEPNLQVASQYDELYQIYKQVYPALVPINHQL
jgi:xylulokinase